MPPPPSTHYILVGQSFGGLYMLLYAHAHPKEVAGILLMDATSSVDPTPLPKKSLPILKRNGNPQNYVATNPLYNEGIGQLPSYLQIRKSKPLPKDVPLVVMYATQHCLPKSWTNGKLICMTKAEEENHIKEQLAIYHMSENHAQYRVDGSHMSFFDSKYHNIVMRSLNRLI